MFRRIQNRISRQSVAVVATLLAFSLSCDSASGPGSGSIASIQLSTVTAASSSIAADGKSTTQITVSLKDETDAPLGKSGGIVSVSTSRGSVGPVSDGNNGTYTATLTSATAAGQAVVTASIAGSTLSSSATVDFSAGPAAAITVANSASNGQTAAVGATVANPPSVKITDANGNAVAGATVTFAVTTGGGSVTGASQTTNGEGIATVGSWVLGNTAGTNTLTAGAVGVGGSVTFSATGVAGAATNIAIANAASNGQAAPAGSVVAIPPSVKVTDAKGNTIAGVAVVFAVASGGGSVSGANATTDASGIAAVGSWTLGLVAGTNTITATSGSLPAVVFASTGTAGPAALIAINTGNNQNATAGTIVAIAPSVKVTDANGNVVSGATVTFAVASGGGSVTGASATTDASGIATVGSFTLGSTAGANTLSATLSGVSGQIATFTATGTALSALVVNVSGRLERSEALTASVVQDGVTLAPAAVSLTLNPADGGQVNADGTIKLLKTGSLIINASAGSRTGSATVNVARPPLIVFDLVRNFTRQIWQVAIDGGDLVQLTRNGSDNQHPSRVGNKLVFASARNGNAFDIFSMNMIDSSETRLTSTTSSERDPNLSPNGSRIVYVSGQSGLDRAVYSNVDGTGLGFVDDISNNTGAIEITPAWSPGSDKVIFSTTATGGTPDIWIQSSLGGFAVKMPSPVNTGSAEVSPVWNSANRIAFHTTRAGTNEIWTTDPTGANPQKLTDGAAPAWLPDGRIVFVRFTGTTGSLFWLDPANASSVHAIDVGGGDAQRPSAVLP